MQCHAQGKLCCSIDDLSYGSLQRLLKYLPSEDESMKSELFQRIHERLKELQRKEGVDPHMQKLC